MLPEIDLIVLSRDDAPLDPDVERGIAAQAGVRVTLHRVFGRPRAEDVNRWETIARARNEGKQRGTSSWVFFLDDDVALPPGCIEKLLRALQNRSWLGAVAADYRDERRPHESALHVAMGATLFRREALRHVTFRWKRGRCECLCCCDDLRRNGYGIDYEPSCRACHLKIEQAPASPPSAAPATPEGFVLAAFDRFHLDKFRQQFLPSLRASGNAETVFVVGYGLSPSDQRRLARLLGVHCVLHSRSKVGVPIRRLHDFQSILDELPQHAVAAYWDAGDVVFQGRLEPLWQEAAAHPAKVLVAKEPISFLDNTAMRNWTLSIKSPEHRHRAWQLMSNAPVLNGGFAAGSIAALKHYFAEAHRLRHSAEMHGSSDWGDQVAMNLYCLNEPERARITSEGWNYCLAARAPGEVYVTRDGRIASTHGVPIQAVHGNGGSLTALTGAWRVKQRVTGMPV
jgi:glycosyltransferase involved in cell wall biosynthesis